MDFRIVSLHLLALTNKPRRLSKNSDGASQHLCFELFLLSPSILEPICCLNTLHFFLALFCFGLAEMCSFYSILQKLLRMHLSNLSRGSITEGISKGLLMICFLLSAFAFKSSWILSERFLFDFRSCLSGIFLFLHQRAISCFARVYRICLLTCSAFRHTKTLCYNSANCSKFPRLIFY